MRNVGKSTRGVPSTPLHFTRLFQKDEYGTSRRTRIDQTIAREERVYFGFEQDPNDDQQRPHRCGAGNRCVYAHGAIKTKLEPLRPFAYISLTPQAEAPSFARQFHIACTPLLAIEAAAGPMDMSEERTEERHSHVFNSDALVNASFYRFVYFSPEGSPDRKLLSSFFAWIIVHSQTGANFDASDRGTLRRQWPEFNRLVEIDFTNAEPREAALQAAPIRELEDKDFL